MSPLSHSAPLATAADKALLSDASGRLSAHDLPERFEGRIAIVIPAYGEAENLSELLPRMPTQIGGVPAAVLVVDDGSEDDTPGAALRAGAVLARLPENHGGGAALRAGYALMVDAGAVVVVTMDADGQHRPEELARLAEPVLGGRVQLVQGSRVLGSAEPGAFARELGVALFNRLVRILVGVRVTDCSNSFRAIQTEILRELDLRQPQFHAAEFLIEAISRGFSFEEVPVSVLRRQHGRSKKPATLRYGLGFSLAIIGAWGRSVVRRGTIRPTIRAAETRVEGPARERAAKPLGLARPAPIESPQRQCKHSGSTEVSDLEALELIAHRPQQHPEREQRRDGQPAVGGAQRLVAGERGLIERAGDQMQAHAHADERQPDAPVGVVLAEHMAHHERPEGEQSEDHRRGEDRDRADRRADRVCEGGASSSDHQPS